MRARQSVERAAQNTDEEFGLPPAPIKAEDELVEVALEMLGTHAVEGPTEPGL